MSSVMLLGLISCSAAPDSAQDSGGDADSAADTGDTADTALETGQDTAGPEWCERAEVTFHGLDGAILDVTESFLTGTYLTLDAPGTLHVCQGTWYARVLIRAAVVVEGHGIVPGDTILSGGESGTILDVLGPAGTLEVSNVTLDRGAGLDVDHNSGGGGIYCEGEGTVRVEDVVFSNNIANDGPGLYVRQCETTVLRSEFVGNVAEDDGGAATIWYSNASFDEVNFSGNSALDGGALCVFYSAATVTNSTIVGNESEHFAAGVWVYESTIVMSDTLIEGNHNPVNDGGGMTVAGEGSLTRVSFVVNESPRGGGLFVYYESVVACDSCSFAGNIAEDVFVADYSEAGGVSLTGSEDWSFSCAGNVCVTE